MSTVQILILALMQGVTEFLPISSSGHLILAGPVFGWPDQGIVIDVAAHVGTLLAVLVYFASSFRGALRGGVDLLRGRWTAAGRLAAWLILATIPVLIVGAALWLADATDALRDARLIAATTIAFAIALWCADRWAPADRDLSAMGWRGAALIGLAQIFALLPGASRSGVTMTAARGLGFSRVEAARFSLLLSAPAIAGAAILTGRDLDVTRDAALIGDAALAAGLAFVSALAAITLMMRWLKTAGFGPFVLYRLVLGGVLIMLIATGAV